MGTWEKFRSLNRRSRRVVMEAGALMISSRIGLRIAGYARWKAILGGLSSRYVARGTVPGNASHADVSSYSDNSSPGGDTPNELARLNDAAARHLLFHSTCLERSLALWWLLRRRGIDAQIHFGGRKEEGRFEAHAWVEFAGGALGDAGGESAEYTAFDEARPLAAREMR
jgi:hypothetical protein